MTESTKFVKSKFCFVSRRRALLCFLEIFSRLALDGKVWKWSRNRRHSHHTDCESIRNSWIIQSWATLHSGILSFEDKIQAKNNDLFICLFDRVEGKIFYAHKIVLVTASPRFQSMLNADINGVKAPTVQIDEIRYHIFQVRHLKFESKPNKIFYVLFSWFSVDYAILVLRWMWNVDR